MPFVKSYKYNLYGDATVKQQVGKIYKFTQIKVVDVPASDIGGVMRGSDGYVRIDKYKLDGNGIVEEKVGNGSRFTQIQVVDVAASDVGHVDGFSPGDLQAFVRSYRYNLFGNVTVEEQVGTIYRFRQGNKVVDVPASDTDAVEGFQGGAKRRNRKQTRKARRNRRRYTRRN
jgi:hypothetical protein